MEATDKKTKPMGWKSRRPALPTAVAAVLVVLLTMLTLGGALLYRPEASRIPCGGCESASGLVVNGAYLGSSGFVTFKLANSGNTNVSILTINAIEGTSAKTLGSVSLSTNNLVPPGETLTISIQFQGVTWQSGVRYTFILIDNQGLQHPVLECLNSC